MRLAWDLLVVLAMAASLALYVRGLLRMRARTRRTKLEALAFVAGWGVIAIALLSPVDAMSDVLFSMHMTQHELLMLVAAPLLVAGRPLVAAMWGLPETTRDRAIAVARERHVYATWRALTHPAVALVLHAVVLWSWHVPAAFEYALHHQSVHALQHLMFFVTAALFWWSLTQGRYGRVGYGAAVFFVFATGMHTGILGALITFARRLWYPTYAARAPQALEDQQLAGLIMWIPAGVIFTLIGLALFAAWLGESERRARAATMLLLLVVFTACVNPNEKKEEARQLTGGDPERGEVAIRRYGCGTCHVIPGVPGAAATVGPPLDKLGDRSYLAGQLANTPDNLLRWIRDPRSINPKTAMPDMGVPPKRSCGPRTR